MSDLIKMLLQAEIDSNAINNIQKQIQSISDNAKAIKIKIDVDDNTLKNITEINNKLGSQLKDLKVPQVDMIESIGQLDKFTKQIYKAKDGTSEVSKIVKDISLSANKSLKVIDSYDKKTGDFINTTSDLTINYKKQRQELEKLERIQSKNLWGISKEKLDNIGKETEGIKQLNDYYRELEKSTAMAAKQQGELTNKINLFKQRMLGGEGLQGEMDIFSSKQKGKYDANVFSQLKRDIEGLNSQTPDATNKLKQLGIQWNSLKQTTMQSGSIMTRTIENMGKFMRFYLAGGLLVGFVREIRNGVNSIKELDASLTELSKVSNLTSTQLKVFTDRAYDAGKSIGRTGKEVIDATAEFKRAGYELREAFELSQQALLLTNIGDGIDNVKEASSSLIAVLKGFKMEAQDTSHIVDALNEVSNNYAVDTVNLTEILKRASGTIGQTGTSFEELLGLATGGFESLRNAEMVASGINMISQRLRGMEEDGTRIEGLIPKIQEAFDKYTKGAVSIIDKQNGGLHSTYEILQQLSRVYPTLSDEAKAYINEVVAGNRQNKVLVAILDNWNNIEKAVESAKNSLGSANAENEKYLQSIEGKSKRLASSMQLLWKDIIDSDTIKMTIDSLNVVVETLNDLANNSLVSYVVQVGIATAATYGLISAMKLLAGTTVATKFIAMIQLMTTSTLGFSTGVAILSKALWASPLFKIALISSAIIGVVKVIDAMTVSLKEQKEIVETLSYELQNLQSEYDALLANDKRTREQEKYLELLQKEIDLKKELLKEETKKAIEKEFFTSRASTVNDAVYDATTGTIIYKDNSGFSKAKENLEKLIELQNRLNNATDKVVYDEINKKISELKLSLIDVAKTVKDYEKTVGDELRPELKELVNDIENVLGVNNDLANSTNKVNNEFINTTKSISELYTTVSKAVDEYSLFNQALKELNEEGQISKSTLDKLIEIYPDIISQTNLQKDSLIDLMNASKNRRRQIIDDEIATAKKVMETNVAKILSTKDYAEALTKLAQIQLQQRFIESGLMFDDATIDNQMRVNVEKARQAMAIIEQTNKQIQVLNGMRSLFDEVDKGKTSTKSSKDEYSALSDRYLLINLELDKNNVLLEKNRVLQSLAGDDIEKKLELMKEEIELNKQRQLSLNALNNERRKEMQELEKTLSIQGFKFEGTGDNRIITNLDQIKGKTKEVEEQFKRYIDLQSNLLPKTSQEWWNLQSSIAGITIEMGKLEDKILQDNLDAIEDVESKIIQIIKKRGELEREELEKTYKEDMEWLEERHKARMDGYKEELDEFKKMIQGKLDALDEQANEEDYIKNLQKEREKANEIQKQIDTLSLDDSLEARNKVIELRKQLADQNEKIADMQTKRERDILKKNLQDQLKDKEENIKQKEDREKSSYDRQKRMMEEDYRKSKEDLDKRYSDYAIHIEAKKALEDGYVEDFEGKMVTLEEAYVKFEDRFGAGMGILGDIIKNDFIAKIDDAISAVKKLQSMSIGSNISNNPLGMSDSDFNKYLQNKKDWESGINRTSTAAENAYLRDKYGISRDDYSYEELKKLKGYDRGGKIDYNGLAVVHGEDDPEWILRDHQLKKIISDSVLSTIKVSIPKIPSVATTNMGSINIGSLIGNVQGNLDKSVIPDLERIAKSAVNDIFEQRRRNLNKKGQFATRGI